MQDHVAQHHLLRLCPCRQGQAKDQLLDSVAQVIVTHRAANGLAEVLEADVIWRYVEGHAGGGDTRLLEQSIDPLLAPLGLHLGADYRIFGEAISLAHQHLMQQGVTDELVEILHADVARSEDLLKVLSSRFDLGTRLSDASINCCGTCGQAGGGRFELDQLQLQDVGEGILAILMEMRVLAEEAVELFRTYGTAIPDGDYIRSQLRRLGARLRGCQR